MRSSRSFLLATALSFVLTGGAHAQGATGSENEGSDNEIVITATKKVAGERVQDVPLSVTALGPAQLEQAKFRTLQDLNFAAPNAQIAANGLTQGKITVSIRGYGVTNSIPSLEQSVGLFIDGIYNPMSLGALSDNFDLESVEILRGPQGILFGKNVSGGAIVMRTTTPKNDVYIDAKVSAETGMNYTGSVVLSGPIVKDVLSAKIAGYYNNDNGWFKNDTPGARTQKGKTWIVRGALRYTPSADLEVIARYERGNMDYKGDAPFQSSLIYNPADKFAINVEGLGLTKTIWSQATLEANLDVGFGNGVITNIFGYRDLRYITGSDADATPRPFFRSNPSVNQDQFSNELRYAGRFGPLELTTGLFYFTQDFLYIEPRILGNGTVYTSNANGGGRQKQHTYGAFLNMDWNVSDQFTVNLGGRYNYEKKNADIAPTSAALPCSFSPSGKNARCTYLYTGQKFTTKGFTPRVGLQWKPSSDLQVYGSWTKGLRGGGFNVRHSVAIAPVPFDDEKVYAIEVGLKAKLPDRLGHFNVAAFRNVTKNGYRESLFPTGGAAGIVSIVRNIADFTIQGVEAEFALRPVRGLTFNGSIGIMDGHYDRVLADLNRDGAINARDKNLKIPLVPPASWSVSLTYDTDLSTDLSGTALVAFGHKDKQAYNDTGVGYLNPNETLDASVAVTYQDQITLSVYGKNILDRRNNNTWTVLGATGGGAGATIFVPSKGRVIGASMRYAFGR